MRRTLSLLVVLLLLLPLAACGKELTPIEKCRQKVVSIGDAFLNYDITGAEAREQLSAIIVPETEGHGQLFLEVDKNFLAFIIAKQDASYDDIVDKVESIRNSTYE